MLIFPLGILWQLLDWAIKIWEYIEKHIKKYFHVEMQGHSHKESRVSTFILVFCILKQKIYYSRSIGFKRETPFLDFQGGVYKFSHIHIMFLTQVK